ncbi:MAG: hypothetical protein HC835_14490 [Oscillatoriales cyanobacterium RM2_1_1]|nr:hypothetical protein [Oscillatoriales cyanobacterium SM2_3_0]NJO46728.1 hypothetical protein [Oscillatoriales cyanobacterium RM2_1_1]
MNEELTIADVVAAKRIKFQDNDGGIRYASPMGFSEEEEMIVIAPEDTPAGEWEQIELGQVLELEQYA